MALTVQNGSLVVRDGKLGTGQGCCCGGGPCNPSTCPNGTQCTPPCVCVDGQCVPETGACCLPETESCEVDRGPCPEDLDCGPGRYCNEVGRCLEPGTVPVGTCDGVVLGPGDPARCENNLPRAQCEAQGGTFHADTTCAEVQCDPTAGVCCVRERNGPFDPLGPWECSPQDTQEACEQCEARCEETGQFEQDQTGTDGWDCARAGDGFICYRIKVTTSCDDCVGGENFSSFCLGQEGPCGEWHLGETCDFCEEKNNPLP